MIKNRSFGWLNIHTYLNAWLWNSNGRGKTDPDQPQTIRNGMEGSKKKHVILEFQWLSLKAIIFLHSFIRPCILFSLPTKLSESLGERRGSNNKGNFLFLWFPEDEVLYFIFELGSFKWTLLSFHDYFTGIFEPKILSALVDFDLSCMHHFHWG